SVGAYHCISNGRNRTVAVLGRGLGGGVVAREYGHDDGPANHLEFTDQVVAVRFGRWLAFGGWFGVAELFMTTDGAIELIVGVVLAWMRMVGPMLLAALVVGLVVGVLQAATQINE